MNPSDIQGTTVSEPATAPPTSEVKPVEHAGFSFHDFLSAINPLQYIPVVGTIYRALTGDVIPETLREAGSLVVSGLVGGPIGLITNIAMTIGEKATGIDPEQIAAAHLGPAANATAPTPAAVTSAAAMPTDPSPAVALTSEQLAAYGVRTAPSGVLKLGDIQGADVLNSIQLQRLGKASAAYAATLNTAPAVAERSA
jgi:hypothetical protein